MPLLCRDELLRARRKQRHTSEPKWNILSRNPAGA